MVCDTYLQKPTVKSALSGNFCKRLNTFDDFWGTFASGSIHSTISQRRVVEKVVEKKLETNIKKNVECIEPFAKVPQKLSN